MSEVDSQQFVRWFRNSAPYINAFRGRSFVIYFGGEAVADHGFAHLIHDLALLNSLGIKLVLVHGARPQIERRLEESGLTFQYANDLRVTDETTLECVKQAAGSVRMEIEARLSMGLANSPMAGAQIRVVSGNFVTAQPLGVRKGVDYQHTGEVRRVDVAAINQQLSQGNIVLLSPLGYSPTGEAFNLHAEDVAGHAAIALQAEKLIYITDTEVLNQEQGSLHEITLDELSQIETDNEALQHTLNNAQHACQRGVHRIHLIDRHEDGALLRELFTRDGSGTLISTEKFEGTRPASIEDIGGLLEILTPLEEAGVLVRRSRERLEMEVDHFAVIERDNSIIGCAALYPFKEEKIAELACLAVHPDYRSERRGDLLLDYISHLARRQGMLQLFVLTTHTAHWFLERGFVESTLDTLPPQRQGMYNYQRNSKVYVKEL